MRGRNNNNNNNNNGNRKAPNPLQRSYESNGPDVKVRGTAQHVAEKYLQLARDAQSSGDPVAAENYFQHAEHYYRILLAAQEQMSQQFGHSFPPNRGFVDDEDGDEDGDDDQQAPFQPGTPQPEMRANGNGGYAGNGAPRQDGEGEGQHNGNGQRFDRQPRQNNDRNFQERNFQDRNGQNRNFQDRNNGDRNNGDRNNNGNRRFDRDDRGGEPRRFDRDGASGQGSGGQGGYQPRPDAPRSDIPVEQPDIHAVPQPANERRFERGDQPERGPRPERRPRRERVEEVEPNADVAGALPSFLTNPVRVPVTVAEPEPASVATDDGAEPATGDAAVKRPRRRRSPREVMDALGSETDNVTE
jgi:hypothetical protein